MDKNFDQEQVLMFEKIEKMYKDNDINAVTDICTSTQLEIFRNEINLLKELGLKKEFNISHDLNERGNISTASSSKEDGKVDRHIVVSSGKITEIIRQGNKKVYKNKIKNALITMFLIKSNKVFSYDKDAYNPCRNCGSELRRIGTGFKCEYCETEYKSEATKLMISRFQYKSAFRGISNFFVGFLILFVIVALYQSGIFIEEIPDSVLLKIYLALGAILTFLFFVLFFISLYKILKSKFTELRIRKKDKNFSNDIFMQHVTDLIQMNREHLHSEKKIIRGVDGYMYIEKYRVHNGKEYVTVKCMFNTLNFMPKGSTIKVKEGREKYEFDIYRDVDTVSKVYYEPDQFTCINCGSHQIIKYKKIQKCSYCNTEIDMSKIDWVLV